MDLARRPASPRAGDQVAAYPRGVSPAGRRTEEEGGDEDRAARVDAGERLPEPDGVPQLDESQIRLTCEAPKLSRQRDRMAQSANQEPRPTAASIGA